MNISEGNRKNDGVASKISITVLSLALLGTSYLAYDKQAEAEEREAELILYQEHTDNLTYQLDELAIEKEKALSEVKAVEKNIEDKQARIKVLQEKVENYQSANDKLKSSLNKVKEEKAELQAKKNKVAVSEKAVSSSSATTTTKSETKKVVEKQGKQETKKESVAPAKTSSSSESYKNWRSMTVSATGYTAFCAGCSGITATGIDLRSNPNQKVIAVDPNVIPLGSKVYVEGYGYAVAGDTGGAIKGNKVDLFMQNKSDALSWGRRNVTIYIK